MSTLVLQVVDNFLLNYNVGDALLLVFVLGFLSTLVLRSGKLLLLHFLTFGLIFFLTPASLMSVGQDGSHFLSSNLQYKLLGLGLLTISPVLYTTMTRRAPTANA